MHRASDKVSEGCGAIGPLGTSAVAASEPTPTVTPTANAVVMHTFSHDLFRPTRASMEKR